MGSPKVAVVTGGYRGIGLEICRQLGERGYRVVLAARSAEKAGLAAAELRRQHLDVLPLALDVAAPEAPALLTEMLEELGGAGVLVNNAAIYLDKRQSALNVSMPLVLETLQTNLIGAWQLTQVVVPFMRRGAYGRIVNVSSNMGSLAEMAGGNAAYRVSKASLNALTRILADELRGTNILVNTMSPGWVRTDMGGAGAPLSPAEGADTAVWLATIPDGGPTGGFFRDRRPIAW
jgi:NAD(P)-dependent dehydrogenase (short-subunit alcohol dehydrogenase family)